MKKSHSSMSSRPKNSSSSGMSGSSSTTPQ
jgi:hypothetical protein